MVSLTSFSGSFLGTVLLIIGLVIIGVIKFDVKKFYSCEIVNVELSTYIL